LARESGQDDPLGKESQTGERTSQDGCSWVVLERLQAEGSGKGIRYSVEGGRNGRWCWPHGIANQTFSSRDALGSEHSTYQVLDKVKKASPIR